MLFVSSPRSILSLVGVLVISSGIVTGQLFGGDGIMELIPDDVLAAVPEVCRSENDSKSELADAIDCAVGEIFQCSGLLDVLDQFDSLIPTSNEDINICRDVEEPFCAIATRCEPCIEKFDALARCIVSNTEEDVIDQSIVELIDGCPLTCDNNSNNGDSNNDGDVVVDLIGNQEEDEDIEEEGEGEEEELDEVVDWEEDEVEDEDEDEDEQDFLEDIFGDVFGDGDGSDVGNVGSVDAEDILDGIDVEELGDTLGDAAGSIFGDDIGDLVEDAVDNVVAALFSGDFGNWWQ
jgi:hypothetical protein